ncbi:MAG: hypothetical protein KF773_08060 [Deltaproteobacteria bacterium]|nr:hypothetical protein [Deltaproteobacteria bacterium]MCW5808283.1 hypothetical protein [Deltaproteobacteria bacterium]
MTSLEESLREILIAKATELFEAYGVSCRETDTERIEEVNLCGILGFFGTCLYGSVVVAASTDAVAQSNPVTREFDRSWSAELTNQLVGRFKNELLRRGLEVSISLPIVLTSTRMVPIPEIRIEPIQLLVGDGVARIWLEVEGTAQLDPNAIADDVPQEGDVLLF